jgi:photosystem II stability/assembly factor-like uncharacterized protein
MHTIQFANDDDGWLIEQGQTVLATTDGGLTWIPSYTGPDQLKSLDFVGNDGWVLAYVSSTEVTTPVGLLHTTDGGQSWTTLSEPPGAVLENIDFTGSSVGWAITTAGTLLDTNDGGIDWSTVPAPAAGSLCVVPGGPVWLGVTNGDVEDSVNGGVTWQLSLSWDDVPTEQLRPGDGLPRSAVAPLMTCSGASAWALYDWGEAAGSSTYVAYTTVDDGGLWSPLLSSGSPDNVSATVVDDGTSGNGSAWFLGYCGPCGDGTAEIVTTSSAAGVQTTPLPEVTEGDLDATFVDPAHGWISGFATTPTSDGGATRVGILASTDGGTTWNTIATVALPS